jgi:hypothetical protein
VPALQGDNPRAIAPGKIMAYVLRVRIRGRLANLKTHPDEILRFFVPRLFSLLLVFVTAEFTGELI